ncbi:MAG: helix-turn-helix transcriptional regulator [Ruminococcaceae bacterium]|nr:helix-turn-helix transcriptional regulator [Oscillospiraceae bacterium]
MRFGYHFIFPKIFFTVPTNVHLFCSFKKYLTITKFCNILCGGNSKLLNLVVYIHYISQFSNCQCFELLFFVIRIHAQKGVIKMPETYERIAELCRKRGITVTDLCKRCDIPRASLSDYKMGRIKSLSALTLSKISEYFSVSVEYLLSGEQPVADDESLKVALFGGDVTVTDEMWNEVKRYAQYIKDRENENGSSL